MFPLSVVSFFALTAQTCCLARAASSQDYRITGFHGIDDEMYSGYMPIHMENNDEGNFFFWLNLQRQQKIIPGKERLIVWLNGGPGCSSMLGNLAENGPLSLKEASNTTFLLEKNPFSWTEIAHVVFVEQPIRVGYSQAGGSSHAIQTEYQIARDFRGFMSSLITTFPHLDGVPVYITGESYAGFYIPWIAYHILKKQVAGDYSDGVYRHINLQGVAIGNGALDYMTMIPSYAEYMYSHGFIPLNAKQYFDKLWTECLDKVLYSGKPITVGAMQECELLDKVLEASGKPNMYNTKTYVQYDSIIARLSLFLNNHRVQEILHVRGYNLPGLNFQPEERNSNFVEIKPTLNTNSNENDKLYYFEPKFWQICNNEITESMQSDHPVSTVPALAYISKYIRVMLYNGALDLSCNHLGIAHALEANTWNGRPWKDATRGLTKFESDVVGQHSKLGNLSLFILRDAGHLAPMDLPGATLDMLKRFINDESFTDILLPSDDYYTTLPIESVKDSIGIDDTVSEPEDDDYNLPPKSIQQSSSPKTEMGSNQAILLSPFLGGLFFFALIGVAFLLAKNQLSSSKHRYTVVPDDSQENGVGLLCQSRA